MADNYGSWGTDIGHDGDAQPMASLKGSCGEAHVQAPMQGENSGPGRGSATDVSGPIAGWNGFLADSGGARGVGGNDSRTKST